MPFCSTMESVRHGTRSKAAAFAFYRSRTQVRACSEERRFSAGWVSLRPGKLRASDPGVWERDAGQRIVQRTSKMADPSLTCPCEGFPYQANACSLTCANTYGPSGITAILAVLGNRRKKAVNASSGVAKIRSANSPETRCAIPGV
jgi:hypothetical protein